MKPCAAQVYELDAFKVTHATKYPGPVMSVGISPNAALLAVGLANGQLLVRKHSHNKGAVPGLPGVYSHARRIMTYNSTLSMRPHLPGQSSSTCFANTNAWLSVFRSNMHCDCRLWDSEDWLERTGLALGV